MKAGRITGIGEPENPPCCECHECRAQFYPEELIYRSGERLLCICCITEMYCELPETARAGLMGFSQARIKRRSESGRLEGEDVVYVKLTDNR